MKSKKNMKNRILNIVSILLIVIGISVIGWLVVVRQEAKANENKLMQNFAKAASNTANSKDPKQAVSNSPVQGQAIAVLTIPKIDLKVPVVDGATTDALNADATLQKLKAAVAHFQGTALPGQKGNCAIAGHRSYTYNQYFNRAGEIVDGDEIDVKTLTGDYIYKVYDTFIVDPNDVSVIQPVTGKDNVITLLTCTPDGKKRLVVRGELTK